MNILVIANTYPSISKPYSGIFIEEQIDGVELYAYPLKRQTVHICPETTGTSAILTESEESDNHAV